MKRIALLTVLLLTIGLASAFAADPIVPVLSEVSAEVQWGIDLDSGHNGFLNTPTFTIYLPLLSYGSLTSTGSGDFYGEIDLTNIEATIAYNVIPMNADPPTSYGTANNFWFTQMVNFAVDDKAATAASAYIVAKPWNAAIGVYAAPGMGLGHGVYLSQTDAVYGTLKPFDTAADNPIVPANEDGAVLSTPYGTYGTYLEYGAVTSTPINVFLKVLSSADWTAAKQAAYAVGADGTLTFDPLTLGLGFYKGFADLPFWNYSPFQGYVTVGYAQPMGDMKLAADLKVDMSMPASGFEYEVSGDAYFYISAVKDKDGKPQYTNYVTANFLYGSPGTWNDLSLHAAVVEDGTSGFVPNLGAKLEANLINLLNAPAWDVIANASYDLAVNPDITVTPAVAFWYGQPAGPKQVALLHLIPTLSVELGMVKNTTLEVAWTGNDLLPEEGGTLKLGVLNFNATITW